MLQVANKIKNNKMQYMALIIWSS